MWSLVFKYYGIHFFINSSNVSLRFDKPSSGDLGSKGIVLIDCILRYNFCIFWLTVSGSCKRVGVTPASANSSSDTRCSRKSRSVAESWVGRTAFVMMFVFRIITVKSTPQFHNFYLKNYLLTKKNATSRYRKKYSAITTDAKTT